MVLSGAVSAGSVPAAEAMPRATAAAIFFEVPVGEKTTVWMVSGFMQAKLHKNPVFRGAILRNPALWPIFEERNFKQRL